MLKLKELEKKLEDILAKETEQSLSFWLLSKRNKRLSYLGEGTIYELESHQSIIRSGSYLNNPEFESADELIPEGEFNFGYAA